MGQFVELNHVLANGGFVEVGRIARPIIFVAQSPDDDRWMIEMLIDHVFQHSTSLLLVDLSPNAATAPRNLLPNQNAQSITCVEHNPRLLIMSQADEVDAHLFHHFHFGNDCFFGHGRGNASMIFVTVRPTQE